MRTLIFATLAALAISGPAAAFDMSEMTPAERQAFRDEVRSYLIENPEVLMEAIRVLEERQANQQVLQDRELVAANRTDLFEDGFSWVGGNPDGDITIVEFIDYRCSFCRRAHPEVKQLLEEDGNIRFIVKEYPILGDESVAASRFAIATLNVAGPDAYHKVHDALIGVRGAMTQSTFERIANDFGLDSGAILAEMGNPMIETIIQRNYRLAERLKVSGTPSFVFETEMVRGYLPLDSMENIVAGLRNSR